MNITGFPPKLWRPMEFRRLVESFGGFLIDVDPRSSGHYDFSILRLKVGVPDVRSIPDARVLHYVGDGQQHRYYFLTFEVNGWNQGHGTNIFRQGHIGKRSVVGMIRLFRIRAQKLGRLAKGRE